MTNKATSPGNKKTAEHSTLLFLTPKKKGVNTFRGNHQKKSASLLFKRLFVVLGLVLYTTVAFAQATFTSNSGTVNWNLSTSWTRTGPADGDGDNIPDSDDFCHHPIGTP
jgi:hypothetical protein